MKEYHDRFFFIAGYTSGGAPYGITWDEELEFAQSVQAIGKVIPANALKSALAGVFIFKK